jgi:hypothetical protein
MENTLTRSEELLARRTDWAVCLTSDAHFLARTAMEGLFDMCDPFIGHRYYLGFNIHIHSLALTGCASKVNLRFIHFTSDSGKLLIEVDRWGDGQHPTIGCNLRY